ncbi:hypothetical protein Pint_14744 [Pistacia integerrima]|uniref:Uncharacterized protein n=1 Tax=Pistacia integerrima TaxID=434235 RepID=A0ACC0Y938_9ROSI|nr:hypothetical protein Pint_14744 [Pistacia integerrima]
MGLNETYLHARSQILMMNPLPSVNQAYSMLVTEESQRNLTESASLEPTVLYSSSNTSQHSSKTKKNWSIICEHCNVRGHKKDNCYRLIGYPADFKFTKKKFSNQSYAGQCYLHHLTRTLIHLPLKVQLLQFSLKNNMQRY